MTAFLIAAAVLVAVAMLFLLPPLWSRQEAHAESSRRAINAAIYRDQLAELQRDFDSGSLGREDFEQGRRELQRRLLEDAGAADETAPAGHTGKRSAVLLGLMLPLAAALLYFALGNLAALSPEVARPKIGAREINEMVAKLAARMEKNPDDLKGWVMLARSYKALGRYEEAVAAFGKAAKLVDEDAQLLSDYAEAQAIASGGSLKGKPTDLLGRALKLDPDNPNALVLAGTAAYERDDYAAAVMYWERLLKQLPPDSDDAQSLSDSLRKARAAAQKQEKRKPAR